MAVTVYALPRAFWHERAHAHAARVDRLTESHRHRQARALKHPVEDFIWVYYSFTPAKLARWHPGLGASLRDVHATDERHGWSGYALERGTQQVDPAAVVHRLGPRVPRIHRILHHTAAAEPRFGCFGLHEWAMVYRIPAGQARHPWPLRLGEEGTREVVESHALRCTHFDAFRFFTESAAPRNAHQLTRADQAVFEQPGCIHATMDLYRWAYQLLPLTSSELVMACLALAYRARTIDMRASAYDLRELGYEPIAIETPEGKAQYLREQRQLAAAGQVLRARLLAVTTAVFPHVDPTPAPMPSTQDSTPALSEG